MRFASRTEALGGARAAAWDSHRLAMERLRAGEDIIVLSIGEADFDTPPAIVDAAVAGLRAGRTRYSNAEGEAVFRETVARYHKKLTGQDVTADNVVIEPGAQCALFATSLACFDPGDEVILGEPAYVTYEAVIGASGARSVYLPLQQDRGFRLDPDAVAAAVTPKTRAIFLNSPHNPSGAMIGKADMGALGEIARAHDLWILSDEVYAELIYEGAHVSPASFPELAERCVTVSSLSKSHAMTGWRLGWAVGPRELAAQLTNISMAMLYGQPAFLQDAGSFALDQALATAAEMKETFRARRDVLCDALAGIPGIEAQRPPAGMFVMADIRSSGLVGDGFALALLKEQGVSVLSGDAFGDSTKGYVRISLAEPETRLAEAARRIAAFMKGRV